MQKGQVLAVAELAEALQSRRERGEKIVFTNGCFDLLHVGHARYLQAARSLGDCLVVGLNTDGSVRRLKGENRPIVPEEERAEMLAALGCVDFVTLFAEDTPVELIERVRPDLHVKGGDYRPEDLPEAAVVERYGGKVVIAPLEQGKSSTNIIERIRETCGDR